MTDPLFLAAALLVGPSIGLLRAEVSSDAEPARTQAMVEALAQAWANHGSQTEFSPPKSCPSTACWDAAHDAGLRYVVRTRLVVEGRSYDLRFEVLDVTARKVVARSGEPCEVCGLEEARELVSRQVAVMSEKLSQFGELPAVVTVRSTPAGADVSVDGEWAGKTPLDLELVPGKHRIELRRPAYLPTARTVEAVAAVAEAIDVDLRPVARSRVRAGPIVGGVLLGAGVGLMIPGATLWALDSRPYRPQCSGANVDAEGRCRLLYNTVAEGASLTVTGVALAIAGSVVLLVSRVRRSRAVRSQRGTSWNR